jgi:hypothetical protein
VHDLPHEEIARELGGDLVWKKEDRGQWIALIRFNRQFESQLAIPYRTLARHETEQGQTAQEPGCAGQSRNPRAPVKSGASIFPSK